MIYPTICSRYRAINGKDPSLLKYFSLKAKKVLGLSVSMIMLLFEDKELFQTVLKSNDKKDYFDEELEEAPPTELIDYDISDYRRLDIKEPKFITERLYKERSINFTFGEKGYQCAKQPT